MATVTLKGNEIHTAGDLPQVGAPAPDFALVNADLGTVTLADFAGKRKIVNIVPSLDTPVCAVSARTFNQRAASLADTVVLVVSADLPFAQKRFCSTEGIDGVVPLSMMRSRKFGKDYGTLITDGPLEGVLARAIVCLDADNVVTHTQLVPEIGQEPDYDAAIAAVS